MAEYSFNPVKEDTSGVMAKRQIWSSKSLELAFEGLKAGKKLYANPFYENNTKLLKGDLNFQRTDQELEECVKCMNDIIYFTKYCKLMTPQGIQNIELRDYQVEYLKHLQDNRLSIFLACRQCGKTTTSAIFILWYILFNTDKNSLVLGNKRKTAVEILDKVKKIYLELPFFLKPGIYKWNESEIVLDNGCRCMCEATTINSGISFTFHCVLADEFAHIPANIMDKFYNNLFPTITAAQARFIITSTQNGYNLFYRLYTAAAEGQNDYAPYKVDWWQVPEWNPDKQCWEKRDEEWHKRQVANYGGEEEFNKQFGTNFDVNASTLIHPTEIRKRQKLAHKFKNKDVPGCSNGQYWFWREDVEPSEYLRDRSHKFVICCDLSEGIGKDFTIFNIMEIRWNNARKLFEYETIGYWRCNGLMLNIAEIALRDLCATYLIEGQYLISIERNTYGELFYTYVMNDLNDNDLSHLFDSNNFNESLFIKYPGTRAGELVAGIRVNHQNKMMGCNQFKRMFETDEYICKDVAFLTEINNFSDIKGNGSYEASFGHDDLVMSAVQLTWAVESTALKSMKDDIMESSMNPVQQEPTNFYGNPNGMMNTSIYGGINVDARGIMFGTFRQQQQPSQPKFGATIYDF